MTFLRVFPFSLVNHKSNFLPNSHFCQDSMPKYALVMVINMGSLLQMLKRIGKNTKTYITLRKVGSFMEEKTPYVLFPSKTTSIYISLSNILTWIKYISCLLIAFYSMYKMMQCLE